MKPAATSRMVRPRKLLETEVPSAEFFRSPVELLLAAASADSDESEVDDTAVLLAGAELDVEVESAIWKRMWAELEAVAEGEVVFALDIEDMVDELYSLELLPELELEL
jgi:hypothetical protein